MRRSLLDSINSDVEHQKFLRSVEPVSGHKPDPKNVELVREYKSGPTSNVINGNFRAGEPTHEEHTKIVDALDHEIAHHRLTKATVLHRGVGSTRDVFGEPKVGNTFHEKGYMSTSTDWAVAHAWAETESHGDDHAVMHLHLPAGHPALRPGAMGVKDSDSEKEVLLPRNTKWKIHSVEHKKTMNGYGDEVTRTHVHLRPDES